METGQMVDDTRKLLTKFFNGTDPDRLVFAYNSTDAINLEARGVNCGWQVLAPGAQAQLWIDIRATEIMA